MPTINDLITIQPKITKVENVPVWERLRSVEIPQNTYVKLRLRFTDQSGKDYNLVGISNLSNTPQLRLFEITGIENKIITLNGNFVDLSVAEVEFVLNSETTQRTGIYNCHYFLNDTDNNTVLFNQIYISIIPTLVKIDNLPQDRSLMLGPITSKELQLNIKNSSSTESLLLQETEFDLSEIIQALRWPVEYWNTSIPDIGIYYSTGNFPYKYQWLQAAIGELLEIAAHKYRRDHLPHRVGDMAIDDMNKFAQYDQAAMIRKQMYQRFVKARKTLLDTHLGFGSRPGVIRG